MKHEKQIKVSPLGRATHSQVLLAPYEIYIYPEPDSRSRYRYRLKHTHTFTPVQIGCGCVCVEQFESGNQKLTLNPWNERRNEKERKENVEMWKWANGWVVTGVESNASGPLNRHLPFWAEAK